MSVVGKGVYTSTYTQAPPCPVCQEPLSVRLARGRKSGKPFIMLVCGRDGRHFRAFITHQPYVREMLEHLEAKEAQAGGQP